MAEINKVIKKDSGFPLLPIIVFLLVICITGGLFLYTSSMKNDIAETKTSITNTQNEIDQLKEDKTIQVAELLKNNKESIMRLEERSKISKYINHLSSIGGPLIKFEGFSLNDGKVATDVTVRGMKGKLAHRTVEEFIKKYRLEEEKDEIFDLNFINSFEGNDAISFNAEFVIKDPKQELEVEEDEEELSEDNMTESSEQ